jgi:hypothetical protein
LLVALVFVFVGLVSAYVVTEQQEVEPQEIVTIIEKEILTECPSCVCEVCKKSRCEGVELEYLPLEFEVVGNDVIIKDVDLVGMSEGKSMLPVSDKVKFYKTFDGNVSLLKKNMVVVFKREGNNIAHVIYSIEGNEVKVYGLNNPHNQFEIISIEDITHVEAKAEVLVE